MSVKERELKEELLHVRQQKINSYHQAMQKKAAEEEQRITQTQINRINDYLYFIILLSDINHINYAI